MTEQEFLTAAKERFRARGLREAKKYLDEPEVVMSSTADSPDGKIVIPHRRDSETAPIMMEVWLDSKQRAREKFTPKKYRKEANS